LLYGCIVRALVERAFIHGAFAKKGDSHPVELVHLDGQRSAHRDRCHLSQNRARRDKSNLRSGEMHRAAAAPRASISAAIKFCGQLVNASAFGRKLIVASGMGVDNIVHSEGMANANSNSLLSRSEMGGR